MENEKMKFKPLHDGMGFHPFSDGLPYAPESKSKFQNGAGANAAGRPRFVTESASPTTRTQVSLKTARQLQEQNLSAQPQATVHTQARPQAIARATSTLSPHDPSLTRKRVFAYLMDTVIHAGFWLSINLTALLVFKFQIDGEILKENYGQFFAFFFISQWLFVGLQEVLFENSLGKVFFNLEFKRNPKSLFLRSFLFMIELLPFGLGLMSPLHDRFGEIQYAPKKGA